ncbi:hypothetical protein PNEG_03221 [Pneumocystis murina B123]|uniref:Uncharacterized protein n=1 Tax=Pneumocystis murina (strain B123) TaxID=1069680 RepID=M7NMM8_PNEMU|nr:hypothetical protein PNEG_03221 [Pneumocystis murina B123]EMR08381.1 hypothetical protein PNEG_03221 [Pneumocystis murina B123]
MNFLKKQTVLFLDEFERSELFPTNIALSSERVFYNVEDGVNSEEKQSYLNVLTKSHKKFRRKRKKVLSFFKDEKEVWSSQELTKLRILQKFIKTVDSERFSQLSKLLLNNKSTEEVNKRLSDDKMSNCLNKPVSALQKLIEYENMLDSQDVCEKKDNIDRVLGLVNHFEPGNTLKTSEMDIVLGLTKNNIENKKNIMDCVLGLNKTKTMK